MPVTKPFVEATVAKLTAARPIRHRAMFGGLGIYLGDAFFAIADDDKLFFKVDAVNLPDYESRGMQPWFLGDQPNNGYREVPADVLSDPDTLGDWIDASVGVVRRKGKKK